jgi:polysaccharide export outer membrane protein
MISAARSAAVLLLLALAGMLAGCGQGISMSTGTPDAQLSAPDDAARVKGWYAGAVGGEGSGPYLLDSGDRLRVFVYAQPNLSRLYTVDQEGMVAVPLIGNVRARGQTARGLEQSIATKLAAQYVKEPHVTVDVVQNRPFFILGEVRNAGQYPYVSGTTVQAAVAIAGGYGDRADERRAQITRRVNGILEKMDVSPDTVIRPGDTIYVYERWL